MNSKLYNKKAKIPKTLIKHLDKCYRGVVANSNTEGYKRNEDLREKGYINYQQLKRLKNWFDNNSKKDNKISYTLNGGERMKQWCNYVLGIWRGEIKRGKKVKSEVGMDNQYIKNHEKDGPVINPGDKHEKGMKKYDTYTEEIKRIKDIINY